MLIIKGENGLGPGFESQSAYFLFFERCEKRGVFLCPDDSERDADWGENSLERSEGHWVRKPLR